MASERTTSSAFYGECHVPVECPSAEMNKRAGPRTATPLHLPIDQASGIIGLDISILASWSADGVVAAIGPDSHLLHHLVRLERNPASPCPRRGEQQDLVRGKDRRVFLYARMDPDLATTESAQVRELETEIESIIATAQLPSSSYMYAIELAARDEYDRPGIDALLALVVAHKIDRILTWCADRLCSPDAFALFRRLCHQHNVSIECVDRGTIYK
jgi:predicted site-specific integrase-resolvase